MEIRDILKYKTNEDLIIIKLRLQQYIDVDSISIFSRNVLKRRFIKGYMENDLFVIRSIRKRFFFWPLDKINNWFKVYLKLSKEKDELTVEILSDDIIFDSYLYDIRKSLDDVIL